MTKSTSGDEDRHKRRPLQPFDGADMNHTGILMEVADRGLMNLRGTSGILDILQHEYRIAASRDVALEVMAMAARRLPECGEPVEGTPQQWEDEEVTRALVFAAGFTAAEIVADYAELWGGHKWRPVASDTYAATDEVYDNILFIQRELARASHLLHMAHNAGECDEEADHGFQPRMFIADNRRLLTHDADGAPVELNEE